MIPWNTILCIISIMFFLISGCGDGKDKNDYSGVSKLIAERNEARYENKKNRVQKIDSKPKTTTRTTSTSTQKKESQKEELQSIILYEEKVEIVGSKSQRTLAKGVAYINKKGQIVKLKILKE